MNGPRRRSSKGSRWNGRSGHRVGNRQSEKADRETCRDSALGRVRNPYAGQSETSGTSRKQYMLLEGDPILVHTVRKFVASPLVHDIVVAVREDDVEWVAELLHKERVGLVGELRVVAGGNSRQESVEN